MPNNERFRLRYDLQMNAADETADMMIYGEICDDWWKWTEADISATDFDKMLKDAKAKGVKNLTIRINSPGGDVNQAIAMRTMLMNSGMEEIKISIEGMCASAATLIACLPGVHVTMSEGGEYMIHNPKSGAWGEAKDLEAGAKRLRNTEADSASIYARKSGQSEETIRGWMNAETWMTAKEAHERGFVDAILDAEPIVASVSSRAMAAMRRMYTHIPESVGVNPADDCLPGSVFANAKTADLQIENLKTAPSEHADTPAEGAPSGATKASNSEGFAACIQHAALRGGMGEHVSNTEPTTTAGEVTENKTHNEEEETSMEIKDVTLEQLRTENPALHAQIMQAGAQQERERIQEIDDLTPAGEEYAEMAATAKQSGTTAMDYHKQIVKHQREKGQKFLSDRKKETTPADKIEGSDPKQNDGKTAKQELDDHAKEMAAIAKEMYPDGVNGMY